MNKLLYRVEVTYFGYVLADSWEEAEEFAEEIVYSEMDRTDAYLVEAGTICQWDSGALVYHGGSEEITIDSVWPKEKE
jgi:hypothetical protein